MNIPQNYFKAQDGPGGDNAGPSTVLTQTSFQLSSNDPIVLARQNYAAEPNQLYSTAQARETLARFLEETSDAASLKEVNDAIRERVLSQFPIFALNEDYMRALTMIIMDKLEKADVLVSQLSQQVYKQDPHRQSTIVEAEFEDSMVDSHNLQGSGTSTGSRKKLTEAERQKLTLIKRKL